MPSPFPGMDPYLEEPSLWPDVHQRMINYISETLQPQVRPKYITRIGERIELTSLGKGYIPDVMVVNPSYVPREAQTGLEVMVLDEPQVLEFVEEERRVPYLEIIYRETGDVVTLLEVLSPVNKVGDGRRKYIQKQADLLQAWVNLVELDLLSGQTSTLARSFEINHPPAWRYILSTSRPYQRHQLEVYPIPLQERLPRCRIPLRQEDDDVVLDLAATFTRCYEVGGYDLLINYQQNPPVSLDKAEEAWLVRLLMEKGMRS